jgi:hypothetical protein
MANIEVAAYKTIDKIFTDERGFVKLTYDFAADTGGTSDTFRLALVNSKIIITEAILHVETAFTSGGSATMDIGATTADADAFGDGIAVATLVDDYAIDTAAGQSLVVDAADYIALTFATAAMTAGKLHLYLSYYNAV